MTCDFCNKNSTKIYLSDLGERFHVCDNCEVEAIALELRERIIRMKQEIIEKNVCLNYPNFKKFLSIEV